MASRIVEIRKMQRQLAIEQKRRADEEKYNKLKGQVNNLHWQNSGLGKALGSFSSFAQSTGKALRKSNIKLNPNFFKQ